MAKKVSSVFLKRSFPMYLRIREGRAPLWLLRAAFIICFLVVCSLPRQSSGAPSVAVTQCADLNLSSWTLNVPCLRVNEALYSFSMLFTGSYFDLINVVPSNREDSAYYCAKFLPAVQTVQIPCLGFRGGQYWADFTLVDAASMSFNLTDAGAAFDRPLLYNAGVSPLTGNISTWFTFYVSYYDENGIAPSRSLIYIDGRRFVMTLMHGDPHDGTYSVTTPLPAGRHSFVVVFTEGSSGQQIALDAGGIPEVTADPGNSPPSLMSAGVLPVHGVDGDIFHYSVRYLDMDGDAAVISSVLLSNGATSPMILGGGSPSDGSFSADISLTGGCYCYKFSFSDGTTTVKLPSFGNFYGPAVDSMLWTFSPPTLVPVTCRRNVNPELFNGKVSPGSGTDCDTYSFRIDYFDLDGDPGSCAVYIDGAAHPMALISGSPSNGTYAFSTASLAPGLHTFYFYASDGRCGEARYPFVGTLSGPDVHSFSPACN